LTAVTEPRTIIHDYRPAGAAADLFHCQESEVLIEGPAGCISHESVLDGTGRTIGDFAESGEQPVVQTTKGEILAGVPFCKGSEALHRVELESGESLVIQRDHLLMTRLGWKRLSDLSLGMELLTAAWNKIKSIRFERYDWFFDLEVPTAHNYFANGFLSHNTGKTRACLEKAYWLIDQYPGIRVLFLRQTRASLTDSVLVTWEQDVVVPGHPMLQGPSRATRQRYHHPNGSEVVLGGMQVPSTEVGHRIMSAEYDVIFAFEATDITEGDWELGLTRLGRRGAHSSMPFSQMVADCNPAQPSHWLNVRAKQDGMVRLLSRHVDNPSLTPQYFQMLDRLTGIRRSRLRDGLWVAAWGVVYDNWNPHIHFVAEGPKTPKSCLVSKDWGFRNPGVTMVWHFDGEGRMYCVAQIFKTEKTIDWWKDLDKDLDREFKPFDWPCDPSEPGFIQQYRDSGIHATKALNDISLGVDLVHDRLALAKDGKPRLFFVRDNLRERDERLATAHQPVCAEDEMESYSWPESRRDRNLNEKEVPVDDHNHGLDAVRYAVLAVDYRKGGDVLQFDFGIDSEEEDNEWNRFQESPS